MDVLQPSETALVRNGAPTPRRLGFVGIVAPLGRDAYLLGSRLSRTGIPAEAATSVVELCDRFETVGFDALLVTSEALTRHAVARLARLFRTQPPWSSVPLIVLVGPAHTPQQAFRGLSEHRSVTVLSRPVQTDSLVSAVRFALAARRRQYEVRDLLRQLERANATLERRVEERTQEVRALAGALTMAEQKERRRVSQVLHDNLQQMLYGLQLKLEVLRARLPIEAMDGQADQVQQTFESLNDLVADTIHLTRTLSVDLSPPVLSGDGLESAFEWLGFRMQDMHAFTVEVEGRLNVRDEHLRTLLFQLGRELLFNVVKHAGVDRAHVRLREEGGIGVVEVEDEGAGFDAQALEDGPANSFGIYSVRERLNIMGGRLEIHSRPGSGTRARIMLPLDWSER